MTTTKTTLIETIRVLLDTHDVGDIELERVFASKAMKAELVAEYKYYISKDTEFEREMHPNIEGTDEEFIAKAHAIIDANADEASEYADNKKGIFYELSPRAVLNFDSYRQSWDEIVEYELGTA